MNVVAIVRLVFGLVPLVVELVDQAEELIPEKGQGSRKLSFVRDVLGIFFSAADDGPSFFERAWDQIERIIALVVSVKNAEKGPTA